MTGTALFFVIVGAGAAAANLMKLVEWLDTPHEAARRGKRPPAEAAIEYPGAELRLESAFFAA